MTDHLGSNNVKYQNVITGIRVVHNFFTFDRINSVSILLGALNHAILKYINFFGVRQVAFKGKYEGVSLENI